MDDFNTGHELFDSIIELKTGSIITLIDEAQTEAIAFLEALLSNLKMPVSVISLKNFDSSFNVETLEMESLNDFNLEVSQFRERNPSGVIIHYYLPHLLLKENEDSILQMIAHWSRQVCEKKLVEFYIIPHDTFPSFEKKLQAITDGVILIQIKHGEKGYEPKFSLLRGSKPDFRFQEFLYRIQNDRLLINWRKTFSEYLPKKDDNIKQVVETVKNNIYGLKVSLNNSLNAENSILYDKLLLSQLIDMRLSDIQSIYPERFEEIIEKIAIWTTKGMITLEPIETVETPKKKSLSLINRLALLIPTRLAITFLKILAPKKIRTVPLDSYIALKKSTDALCAFLSNSNENTHNHVKRTQAFFHDFATRITVIEHQKAFGQTCQMTLDPKYIPKFSSLAIYQAYRMVAQITKKTENSFEIVLPNCIFCMGMESTEPMCDMVSTTLVGLLSVLYKKKFVCREIECKAMNNKNCKFLLEKME